MAIDTYATLCRICLEDEACYYIFKGKQEEDSLLYKLKFCLNVEIEDVDGYPKHICKICNSRIDILYAFIKKFRESCEILETGWIKIKKEESNVNNDYDNCSPEPFEELSCVEIDAAIVKEEPQIVDDELDKRLATLVKQKHLRITKNIKIDPDITNLPVKPKVTNISKKKKVSKKNSITKKKRKDDLDGLQENKSKKKDIKKNQKQTAGLESDTLSKLCDLCGEVFQKQECLVAHKKQVHGEGKSVCPKCNNSYASNFYLERHLLRVHGGEKKFVCECGAAFALTHDLRNHIRSVHNKHLIKKTRVKCKFCTKTFVNNHTALTHERSVHTGERPAVCTVCDSRFFNECYLREHMRLHTGDMKFKCPICSRGHAQLSNMKSHLRIHRRSEVDENILKKLRPSWIQRLKD